MENRGLGYTVLFEIDYFESSPSSTRFHVRASFDELEADNRRTKKRWKKNRQKSFLGSTFHFMRSLMRDNLKAEGYEVYLLNSSGLDGAYKHVSGKDDLILTDRFGRFYLDFEGSLIVEYQKEFNHPSYDGSITNVSEKQLLGRKVQYTNSNMHDIQTSSITLEKRKVRLLKNGQIAEPEEVLFYGYWSWERMSELMPIDYNPKSDN